MSQHECHKKIVIRVESFSEETKLIIRSIYPKDILHDITLREANELLSRCDVPKRFSRNASRFVFNKIIFIYFTNHNFKIYILYFIVSLLRMNNKQKTYEKF